MTEETQNLTDAEMASIAGRMHAAIAGSMHSETDEEIACGIADDAMNKIKAARRTGKGLSIKSEVEFLEELIHMSSINSFRGEADLINHISGFHAAVVNRLIEIAKGKTNDK